MKLLGMERVIPYATGENTGEVAEKLQENYKIFEKFADDVDAELQEKFLFYLDRYLGDFAKYEEAFQKSCEMTSLWLTDRWREYIEGAEHGLKTKASELRGDPAFIDTSFFYKNTLWELRQ